MKKKIWVMILTAVLLLNLLPGMTPEASAADDTSSTVIGNWCYGCKAWRNFRVTGFIPTPISSTPHPELHWAIIECMSCGNEQECSGGSTDNGGIFKHTGGTETPTCTTGKTCTLCGAEYGKLGHIWSEWKSNENNTHTRTCERPGCGEVETGKCGGDSTVHCGMEGKCAVCGGEYYHAEHTFPERWKWGSDPQVRRDAESHWLQCFYCTEGKAFMTLHSFVPGNMYLKSPATCVSKPVYYKNCSSCYYQGTETYLDPYGSTNPNNHTGNEEIRGAVEATCTTAGYTGDTYCKDCNALLSTGTVIPAAGHVGGTEVRGAKDATCTAAGYTGDTYCKGCDALLSSGTAIPTAGHTGGTATCKDLAVCEVCRKPYGETDSSNHVGGTEVRGKKDATCTTEGYTGDTCCKGCGAVFISGEAIPATGHRGGMATCLRRATCEICGRRYGEIAYWHHSPSCVAEWTITETEHEQKYSLCGAIATEKGEHTFGDWTVTREAAPGKEGEQERVCELCEYTETEAIPALEIRKDSAPAPTAEPEPAAEPAAEPVKPASEGSSVWWIFLLAGVAAGVGAGVAVRRKKKK